MDTSGVKKVLIAVAGLIALVGAFIFYWSRNQEIRFVENFPDAFEYYVEGGNAYIASEGNVKKSGQTIIKLGSNEYAAIKTWFEKNANSWKNDISDYAPNRILKSKTLTINILKTKVVVNYTSDGKSWSQVSRPKSENDLEF